MFISVVMRDLNIFNRLCKKFTNFDFQKQHQNTIKSSLSQKIHNYKILLLNFISDYKHYKFIKINRYFRSLKYKILMQMRQ